MKRVTGVGAGEIMWLIFLLAMKIFCSMGKRQAMSGTKESGITVTTILNLFATRHGIGMQLRRTTVTTKAGTRRQAQTNRR